MESMNILSPSSSTVVASTTPLLYLDKCAVCGKPAPKKCGGCALAFYCGSQHQRADWLRHKTDCKMYEVIQHEGDDVNGKGGSLYMVATKLIPADKFIISEYPLVSFEAYSHQKEESLVKILEISECCPVRCFGCESGWVSSGAFGASEEGNREDLYRCLKCGLPVCSLECSETVMTSKRHAEGDCKILQDINKKETRSASEIGTIPGDLRILRVIHKENQKGTPVTLGHRGSMTWSPLLKQAKILKTAENEADIRSRFPLSLAAAGGTAEGVEVVRLLNSLFTEYSVPVDTKTTRKQGLFEKHCFLGHSCAPNTEWWVDTSGYHVKLLVRAIRSILPGERLTTFRSSDPTLIYNPTIIRRQKLLKQVITPFPCECERCVDPSELGTFLSGVRCTVCKDVSSTLTCNYYYPSPLEKRPAWTCSNRNCRSTKTFEQILVVTMKAEKELESIWKNSVIVSTAAGSQCEVVITKLQNFVVKHQRKILHPNHYLILIARNRINKVVSHFLGTGEKLFLCVVTGQPRAYDYCAYKVEHLNSYLGFITKVQERGTSRISGKLLFELAFCEGALLFRDFQEERLGGTSFVRRLSGIMENVTKCQKILAYYHDCKNLVECIKQFGQMLKKLFGPNFMTSNRLKQLQGSSIEEENLRGTVKDAITRWSESCEKIDLRKLYINPTMCNGSGASNENLITKDDLHTIVMDVPQIN